MRAILPLVIALAVIFSVPDAEASEVRRVLSAQCDRNSDCDNPLICNSDNRCVYECSTTRDCPLDKHCVHYDEQKRGVCLVRQAIGNSWFPTIEPRTAQPRDQ